MGVVIARGRARGRGAKAKLKAAARLEELADRCEKVAVLIRQRVAGEPITDRLVSLSDPDARPIRKGKLGKPNLYRWGGYADAPLPPVVIVLRASRFPRKGSRSVLRAFHNKVRSGGRRTLSAWSGPRRRRSMTRAVRRALSS